MNRNDAYTSMKFRVQVVPEEWGRFLRLCPWTFIREVTDPSHGARY
ncbi:hypothetical protein [Methanoregula sp.]